MGFLEEVPPTLPSLQADKGTVQGEMQAGGRGPPSIEASGAKAQKEKEQSMGELICGAEGQGQGGLWGMGCRRATELVTWPHVSMPNPRPAPLKPRAHGRPPEGRRKSPQSADRRTGERPAGASPGRSLSSQTRCGAAGAGTRPHERALQVLSKSQVITKCRAYFKNINLISVPAENPPPPRTC